MNISTWFYFILDPRSKTFTAFRTVHERLIRAEDVLVMRFGSGPILPCRHPYTLVLVLANWSWESGRHCTSNEFNGRSESK